MGRVSALDFCAIGADFAATHLLLRLRDDEPSATHYEDGRRVMKPQ